MSDFTLSTNMNMPIPTVGVSPGPDYADNLNSSLTIVDGHDHSPGYGVPITPSGLNISSDLSFGGNNATSFRSVRFTAQGSTLAAAADLGCLYESGVDLYYNDGLGNQVRITQSGSVTGATGTITGLPSGTASASFAASTFTFQSATLTAASVDGRNFILRNAAASSKGLTLSPPAAMGSDFSLVLPSLPVSQKIMTLDNSGNMSAPYVVDNSTIEISTNTIQVKASGIGTTQIADNAVTTAKIIDAAITSAKFASSIDLPIFAQTGGRYNVVGNAGDARNICIVSGTINTDGTTALGTGFSASKTGTGLYTITFTTTFTTIYSFVAQGWNINAPSAGSYLLNVITLTTAGSTVETFATGVRTDMKYSFIAIGAR